MSAKIDSKKVKTSSHKRQTKKVTSLFKGSCQPPQGFMPCPMCNMGRFEEKNYMCPDCRKQVFGSASCCRMPSNEERLNTYVHLFS
ncbi:MAG: hypothetical protein Sylvanvirus16_19 [Sylvanvirus sp.]|uniref:Uncharacterized protein n=1 Tax=Sylvanvirus sp. TaxID=2487774 RepID=A0A3G5AIJ7_9VIRU|nr:MAG: hypothetical protein Sylvanvirus16_19 [Sylvanvirus sp.]